MSTATSLRPLISSAGLTMSHAACLRDTAHTVPRSADVFATTPPPPVMVYTFLVRSKLLKHGPGMPLQTHVAGSTNSERLTATPAREGFRMCACSQPVRTGIGAVCVERGRSKWPITKLNHTHTRRSSKGTLNARMTLYKKAFPPWKTKGKKKASRFARLFYAMLSLRLLLGAQWKYAHRKINFPPGYAQVVVAVAPAPIPSVSVALCVELSNAYNNPQTPRSPERRR